MNCDAFFHISTKPQDDSNWDATVSVRHLITHDDVTREKKENRLAVSWALSKTKDMKRNVRENPRKTDIPLGRGEVPLPTFKGVWGAC